MAYIVNQIGHEINKVYLIGDHHNHERDIKIQFLAHFNRKLRLFEFLQSTIVLDERPCWISRHMWRQIVKWIGQECRECKI